MLDNLKVLAVVLPIAMMVFILAKPVCLRFMAESDFARRRNVWFVLTLTAFLSTSPWLYVFVAFPLLAWSARKDTNALALYLLVFNVIPPGLNWEIPVVGINKLFDLNNYRILAFAILIPAAWRLVKSSKTDKTRTGQRDWVIPSLVAYGVLQLALLMPYESSTHSLRRGFLFALDILLLYFVVSRGCTSRRAIVEIMAAYCLACAIFAPLALFESLKTWLLYDGIAMDWGIKRPMQYLFRSDSLRAQVSTGHALTLGYMMAIGFGFWLYLRSHVKSTPMTYLVAAWMWVGLLAAYSRGPWIVAIAIFFVHLGLGPNGAARFFQGMLASAIVGGLVLVTPVGGRIIDNLPFVGTVEADNVVYRQQLAAMSWEMVKRNPLFGDPFYLLHLEDLRQGQGMIDLVNTYAAIAMEYGVIGLSLFLWPFFAGMRNALRTVRNSAGRDPDLSLLGATLLACMFGTLLMMATGSIGNASQTTYYVLAGLAVAYARLKETDNAAQVQVPRPQHKWRLKQG